VARVRRSFQLLQVVQEVGETGGEGHGGKISAEGC
jgi:hypothetical protein